MGRLLVAARRQIPRAFFALALTMQVVAPALHAGHDADRSVAMATASAGSVFEASPISHPEDAAHDAAGCLQCRLVSQLGSLFPPSGVGIPVCRGAGVLDPPPVSTLASVLVLERGAPRAPPVLS